jgi:hypothetical protein
MYSDDEPRNVRTCDRPVNLQYKIEASFHFNT